MKILIVTQYFYPENFRINDVAFELVRLGHKVDALVGIPNYPEGKYYKNYGLFKKRIQTVNGVRIFRAFQTPRGVNASKFGLSLNYLTYAFSASLYALFLSFIRDKYDSVIVFQTSPITQAIPALIIGKIKKTPIYLWVQDLWPETVITTAGLRNKNIIFILESIVKKVYNESNIILISSPGFKDLINKKGDYAHKIIYFPNWCEDLLKLPIIPIPDLPSGFIIMMAGNLGSVQSLDSVLFAALELKNEKNIKWVFIGDGSKRKWIENFINEYSLNETVYLLGRHPYDAMPAFFQKADIMLISLKSEFPHLQAVIPTRFQSYMSASKPVIAMLDGGVADLINKTDCGYSVHTDDYTNLARIIKDEIINNPQNLIKKGINGRRYFEANFYKDNCLKNLVRILENRNQ